MPQEPAEPRSSLRPTLDAVQRSVLEFELGECRAVIGAPGSGKTETLFALYEHLLRERGLHDREVLVLGANRVVAAQLKAELDSRMREPAGAPRARSSSSLALALIAADRRVRGELPIRLLTGAVQDELVAAVIEDRLHSHGGFAALTRETLSSPAFRNQFREMLRVLDETGSTVQDLASYGVKHDVPEWVEVAELVTAYLQRLNDEYPLYRDNSAMHADAVALLDTVPVGVESSSRLGELADLRVILVDDAQELTGSALLMLRALVQRGVTVWVFGDPDMSTGAFHGSAHRVLSDLDGALGVRAGETVTLPAVYRHPAEIRLCVQELTSLIGTAGAGAQRMAPAIAQGGRVLRAVSETSGEAAGAIAHLLRERHLGLGAEINPVDWSEMAVICRTRHEAQRLARQLAAADVPTDIAAGGVVLAEHPIVRDLLVLAQLSFGWVTADTQCVTRLLTGPIGSLDPLALKRLGTAMQLATARTDESSTPPSADALILEYFLDSKAQALIDTRQSRALERLASVFAAGCAAVENEGDLSEVLWALWDASGLASVWERHARGVGPSAERANRALDAVIALFFASTRFEEQELTLNREQFVASLLSSSVPEDSLARSNARSAVTVTTPQGMIGRSASVVVVTQLQEGVWPNTKSRGSLMHLERFEHLARGFHDAPLSDRRDVLHDELRLLAQAVSRATTEVVLTAVRNEETMPSTFFSLQTGHEPVILPSSRLTLRGLVATLRRRLNEDPTDTEAAEQLAILATRSIPGADPAEWYGMIEPSTTAPLHDLSDENATVSVSPSRLETFEECPLDWAIARLGGERTVSAAAVGTLLHLAMEKATEPTVDAIMARVDGGWGILSFDAEWEQQRSHNTARAMAQSLASYLTDFDARGGALLSAEQTFTLPFGHARVRGTIDRVELVPAAGDAPAKVLIVDLKTQKNAPSGPEIAEHTQLQLYQLALRDGAIDAPGDELAGAALLLVHPKATGAGAYKLATQAPLTEEQHATLISRIERAAQGMSQASFTARVEHHCSDRYSYGNCRIHVIRPVSFG